MVYGEAYSRLAVETAMVLFIKADGKLRVMLATRNMHTASLRGGITGKLRVQDMDNRCSPANGNIAVVDLEIMEARTINVVRALQIKLLGSINDADKLSKALEYTRVYRAACLELNTEDVITAIALRPDSTIVEDKAKDILGKAIEDIFKTV